MIIFFPIYEKSEAEMRLESGTLSSKIGNSDVETCRDKAKIRVPEYKVLSDLDDIYELDIPNVCNAVEQGT